MRVFLTGATGFVGSAIVPELIGAGHRVVGLARSDSGAAKLAAAGAEPLRGDLEDLDGLRRGAESADGVIHCGFVHDFANFKASCETDRRAIEAMGAVLAGSDRPFIVTFGTMIGKPSGVATEEDAADTGPTASPRAASEGVTLGFADKGVRAMLMRLSPSVHDAGDHGFVPTLIQIAREKGVSAYIGDGQNRWPGVHRLDAAYLYRLALENGAAGARYHAVADDGVPTREIAETIGRRLGVPVVSKSKEEAADHFGWIAYFFGLDGPASSALTRERLGWTPTHPGLLTDLDSPAYF